MKTEDIDSSNVSVDNYMKGIELLGRVVFVMDGEESSMSSDDWHWSYSHDPYGRFPGWSVSHAEPFGVCLPQQLVHPSFGCPEVRKIVVDDAWKRTSERLRMETKCRLPEASMCMELGEDMCRVTRISAAEEVMDS